MNTRLHPNMHSHSPNAHSKQKKKKRKEKKRENHLLDKFPYNLLGFTRVVWDSSIADPDWLDNKYWDDIQFAYCIVL